MKSSYCLLLTFFYNQFDSGNSRDPCQRACFKYFTVIFGTDRPLLSVNHTFSGLVQIVYLFCNPYNLPDLSFIICSDPFSVKMFLRPRPGKDKQDNETARKIMI